VAQRALLNTGMPAPEDQAHLRVCGLGEYGADCVIMTRQDMGLHFGAHVPHATHAVTPASHQQVQGWVQRQGVHSAQVTVVMPYDLQRNGGTDVFGCFPLFR